MRRRAIGAAAWLLSVACAHPGHGDWALDERRELRWLAEPRANELEGWVTNASERDRRLGVSVPIGVERRRLALSAAGFLSLGDGVSIVEADGAVLSTVAGLGGVEIGDDARMGSVYSGAAAPLRMGARSISHGFVKAGGPVQLAKGAGVEVGALAGVPIGAEAFSWPMQRSTGAGPALDVGPGDVVSLEPDVHYASVRVSEGGVVALGAGHHPIDELVVAERAQLRLEPSTGPAYVWVQQRLEWRGVVGPDAAASRLLVGYAGSTTPVIGAGVRGTLVSPHADLELNDAASPYVGAFFGRGIRVAARVVIRHSAFDPE